MIGRIEQLFRAVRRGISRSEWAIRLLRLPVSAGTANQPGLLLIQIDGLARRQMERALERGRLPFLQRLIRREQYEARTLYSGLPSTTPAVQGELHYGVSCAVPAFSFMDRASRRVVTMFNSSFTRSLEERLGQRAEGLLRGGSSWCNIYTGGAAADESHFCSAAMGIGDLLRSQSLLQLVTFPLLHLPALLRIFALSLLESGLALREMLRGVVRGEGLGVELRMAASRVLVAVGVRELVTIGAKVDLARGLPIVHVNFVGYDEQSHRRGPSSAFAHWSLLGIDRAVRDLYRAAQRSQRRDYQVWIFSDHGQEATLPFDRGGAGLEQVVREAIDDTERATPLRRRRTRGRSWAAQGEPPVIDGPDFSLAALGPVAHLYLAQPRSLAERGELAERLVREGGVPGVLVRGDRGKVHWIHARGVVVLPDEATGFLPHPGSLAADVARDLVTLCEHELAGDLVLVGWLPDQTPVSFADERGAHAGPGPDETQGFVLLPALTRLPDSARDYLRPRDVRAAALHFLGREPFHKPQLRPRSIARALRVMTYNVHSCRGMDGRISPRRIARVIEQYDPDVVALQELDLGRARSARDDQPRRIAEALGMELVFCPTVVEQGEQYGHAVLARFPLEVVRTQVLCGGKRFRQAETRGALWVRLARDGLVLNVLNTHFGLNRRERQAQAEDLLGEGWIGAIGEEEPLIVCGDFNMSARSQPYRALARRLRDVQRDAPEFQPLKTFTTFHPFARIDHIFVSRHFTPDAIRVPRTDLTRVASDHLPLIVDLGYRQEVGPAAAVRAAGGY